MRISVDEVKPGAVLSRPAVDFTGKPIYPAATQLTVEHIRTLRSWGVKSIDIQSAEKSESRTGMDKEPRHVMAKIKRLEERFRPHADNPIMSALYRAELANLQAKMEHRP